LRVERLGCRKEGILEDTREARLVEGHDVDAVALVLLDDVGGVVVGVEGVHQDERYVDVVCAIEVLDLADGEVEEGHAITNFNDGFRANTTHRCTKTTVELDNSELLE